MSNSVDGVLRGRAARWSVILDQLATQQTLTVTSAAELLGVSQATVRRDFRELAERQLANRNHGGVVATAIAYELPYRYRSTSAEDSVARLARAAAGLVRRTDRVIALNGGTTATATARAIAATKREPRDGQLTMVTNALNIANEVVLRPHVRCISLGGVARPAVL